MFKKLLNVRTMNKQARCPPLVTVLDVAYCSTVTAYNILFYNYQIIK